MNTAFTRWGCKLAITKVHQRWKINNDHRFYYYAFNHDVFLFNSFKLLSTKTSYPLLPYSPLNIQTLSIRWLSISRNRCWKCNAVVTERDLVCMTCGTVQEPNQKLNYFELFKETPHFDVDTRNLTVKFRRLQTLLHPDKFATRPENEQYYSAEQSSLVNKAYQTLLRPIDRGLYLLELHSKPLSEDDVQMEPDFLTSVMEINELLEDCTSANTLESIRHTNDAKIQILYSDVSVAFKEKNIDKARDSLAKLKYFINIDEKIRKLEDELGITRD